MRAKLARRGVFVRAGPSNSGQSIPSPRRWSPPCSLGSLAPFRPLAEDSTRLDLDPTRRGNSRHTDLERERDQEGPGVAPFSRPPIHTVPMFRTKGLRPCWAKRTSVGAALYRASQPILNGPALPPLRCLGYMPLVCVYMPACTVCALCSALPGFALPGSPAKCGNGFPEQFTRVSHSDHSILSLCLRPLSLSRSRPILSRREPMNMTAMPWGPPASDLVHEPWPFDLGRINNANFWARMGLLVAIAPWRGEG